LTALTAKPPISTASLCSPPTRLTARAAPPAPRSTAPRWPPLSSAPNTNAGPCTNPPPPTSTSTSFPWTASYSVPGEPHRACPTPKHHPLQDTNLTNDFQIPDQTALRGTPRRISASAVAFILSQDPCALYRQPLPRITCKMRAAAPRERVSCHIWFV
jgi:hypothetical protein